MAIPRTSASAIHLRRPPLAPHPGARRRDGFDDLRTRTARRGLPRRVASAITPCAQELHRGDGRSRSRKLIEDIHRAYLDAGADIIETDTFNSNAAQHGRVPVAGPCRRDQHAPPPTSPAAPPTTYTRRTPDKPRFVAGSIGPTNKTPVARRRRRPRPPRRDLRSDGRSLYAASPRPWSTGGVDILLAETSFDTLVMKACLFAIDQVLRGDTAAACR